MSACLKFSVSAPGKVILFGEHSVLYAEPALATAIDKRTTLKFELTGNNDIVLDFKTLDLYLRIPIVEVNLIFKNVATYKADSDHSTECDRHVANLIQENIKNLKSYETYSPAQRVSLQCVFYLLFFLFYTKNRTIDSLKIEIISELVTGAGTGSSASFSVCLAAALYRYSEFVSDTKFEPDCYQLNDEQKSVVNKWAFACEQMIHGKASGVDNFICTYGSMVNISFEEQSKGNKKADFKLLQNVARLRVLLVNSGVNRNTAMMVKKVAELHERNPDVTKIVFKAVGEVTRSATQILKDLKNIDKRSDEYAEYFTKLEDLVSINNGLLISLGVSHPTLNKIFEISSQFDLKSKLTGAGGGGYAFAIIPPNFPIVKLDQCKKSLEEAGFSVAEAMVGEKGVEIYKY